jgi:hypothetical protein
MRRRMVLMLGVLAVPACSNESYQLAPVSGRVTLDGAAVANVFVNFQPMAAGNDNPGPGSSGKTDGDGRYTLRAVTGTKGAVVGKHQVRISGLGGESSKQSDAGIVQPKDIIPACYNRDTKLIFEVPAGGTDQANFPLVRVRKSAGDQARQN